MMKKPLIILIFFICILMNGSGIFGEGKRRIAVLEIEAKNTPRSYADIIRDMVEVDLYKTGAFNVLERKQIELVLKEQGFQATGCVDTQCAVEIGKILSADLVIVGSLSKISRYMVLLKFIDVRRGEIMRADSEHAAGDGELEAAAERLVNRITTGSTGVSAHDTRGAIFGGEKKPGEPRDAAGNEGGKRYLLSPQSMNEFVSDMDFVPSVYASILRPHGSFGKFIQSDYGTRLFLGFEKSNVVFGPAVGYWDMDEGKEGDYTKVAHLRILMLAAKAGYSFLLPGELTLSPAMSLGLSYMKYQTTTDLYPYYYYPNNWEYKRRDNRVPCYTFGMYLSREFKIPGNYTMAAYLGFDYGVIRESYNNLKFTMYSLGVGSRF